MAAFVRELIGITITRALAGCVCSLDSLQVVLATNVDMGDRDNLLRTGLGVSKVSKL